MKIFLDNANISIIDECLKRGFIRGITTNPAIISQEKKRPFEEHIQEIIDRMHYYGCPDIHLSVEVFSDDTATIIKQAEHFRKEFGNRAKNLSIKVQIGWNEMEAIHELKKRDFSVNCTCCMGVPQAVMAAAAGAKYVSLFWGRIRSGGDISENKAKGLTKAFEDGLANKIFTIEDFDPARVVRDTRTLLDASYPGTEIIVGSIRSSLDVKDAGLAGAHIVTVPPKFFKEMVSHFKTDEVVNEFFTKFSEWQKA